jgi:hypothetical protein
VKPKALKREMARCETLFTRWQFRLGLKWWNVQRQYYSSEKDYEAAKLIDDPVHTSYMIVWAQWPYLHATIGVNCRATRRLPKKQLERIVIHELLHCLVNEMREPDPDRKHEERVVTTLTDAVVWTRDFTGKKP